MASGTTGALLPPVAAVSCVFGAVSSNDGSSASGNSTAISGVEESGPCELAVIMGFSCAASSSAQAAAASCIGACIGACIVSWAIEGEVSRSASLAGGVSREAFAGSSTGSAAGGVCLRRWVSLRISGSAPANPIERARRVGENCFPSTPAAWCVSGIWIMNPASISILQRVHGIAAADQAAAKTSGLVAAASGSAARRVARIPTTRSPGCAESPNTACETMETKMPATPLAMQTGTGFHSTESWRAGVSELTK